MSVASLEIPSYPDEDDEIIEEVIPEMDFPPEFLDLRRLFVFSEDGKETEQQKRVNLSNRSRPTIRHSARWSNA